MFIPENGGDFECDYLYCFFSGNDYCRLYCMKLAEGFSAVSLLVAVVCEIGQRGLKIYRKMRHMLGFS